MPEFWALRCFNCQAFVNQQKKKIKKWKCPICSNKQSVIKIYGKSNRAKDIRLLIVELNRNRGEYDRQQRAENQEIDPYLTNNDTANERMEQTQYVPSQHKWEEFETENNQNNIDEFEDSEYVLQIPQRKSKNNNRKRSRNEYENCEKYQSNASKKQKITESHSNNIGNKTDMNGKEDLDEFNWDVWEENDSNKIKTTDSNDSLPPQSFVKDSLELTQTQKFATQNNNALMPTQQFDTQKLELSPTPKVVMTQNGKNILKILESESDSEAFIDDGEDSHALIGVEVSDNKKNENVSFTLQSQQGMNDSNVYQTESTHSDGIKWSDYL